MGNCQKSDRMSKPWLEGLVAFTAKNKDPEKIQNYRPAKLVEIIYKIWATI